MVAAVAVVVAAAADVCQMYSSTDQWLVPAGADSLLSKIEMMAAVAAADDGLSLYLVLVCFEWSWYRLDCQLVG